MVEGLRSTELTCLFLYCTYTYNVDCTVNWQSNELYIIVQSYSTKFSKSLAYSLRITNIFYTVMNAILYDVM